MQTRRAIVYTLVVAALSGCASFDALEPYERLLVEPVQVPDSAVLGSSFDVRVRVLYGACDEDVHVALRSEGDTVIVIGLARYDGRVCNSILLQDIRTVRLTAQPAPTMTIRFFPRGDGSSPVRNIVVTPQ